MSEDSYTVRELRAMLAFVIGPVNIGVDISCLDAAQAIRDINKLYTYFHFIDVRCPFNEHTSVRPRCRAAICRSTLSLDYNLSGSFR